MNLTVHITAKDYLKANYLHLRPRPFLKFLIFISAILVVIVLFISFAAFSSKGRSLVLPITMAVCVAYLPIFLFIILPFRSRKIYLQQKLMQLPCDFSFDESSMQAKSGVGTSSICWDMLHKWKENKDLILVYQSDAIFHMFPKRCFASESDINEFRSILIKHLGKAKP